ncbi:MAG: anti-sigma F factor [Defluviitaleaceae bacterium]|nr:anti-sigma F factor [Defluviitaleaceae bacterium]
MTLIFKNDSKNESLARVAVTAFISQLDPTINCINDIKTSVSEAVTNAIIHGYEKDKNGDITIYCRYVDNKFYIEVKDNGVGIFDVNLAKTPLFTSKPEMDRSGLGFTLMETFMDTVEVESVLGSGTIVRMTKTI